MFQVLPFIIALHPFFPSNKGLKLKKSAFKIFIMASSGYQLSWQYKMTLLYSNTHAAPQFLKKLTPFIHVTVVDWV